MNKGLTLIIATSLILSVLGMVFGGLVGDYSIEYIAIYGFSGFFLGAIMAPEIEPGYFRHPVKWQILFSIIFCLLIAYILESPNEGYLVAVFMGLFVGASAHYWIKHVRFP